MTTAMRFAERLIHARRAWEAQRRAGHASSLPRKEADEGGCGVIGLVASEPVTGQHLFRPLSQMNNRGNGKGGGIAVAGCFPDHSQHFALHVALMDTAVRDELEKRYIEPLFHIEQAQTLGHVDDYRDVGRLEVAPPEVVRYFVRVKQDVLDTFAAELGLEPDDRVEAECVSRNSCAINDTYYRADDPRAFVLSHGRNLMILKGVGYAEDILRYYQLEDFGGLAWIGHQRYPTRGRVWHPGGAHPFAGLDEALVHNGDLANYQAIVEYLAQRGIAPRFSTDTEVAALLFDLYNRVYHYPLEHIFEALAPTTERDFAMLPKDKQRVYRALRASHLHGSPDGPFFFILLRTLPNENQVQLLGITDTSMLRPQVFAWHQGELQIGLVASEKQAIDAYLEQLSATHPRVAPAADRVWNARGGSYTDGGAFVFTVSPAAVSGERLTCADKFGSEVQVNGPPDQPPYPIMLPHGDRTATIEADWATVLDAAGAENAFDRAAQRIPAWSFDDILAMLAHVTDWAKDVPSHVDAALGFLTQVLDQRYDTGTKKPAAMRAMATCAIRKVFDDLPLCDAAGGAPSRRVDFASVGRISPPPPGGGLLAIDAVGFEAEGGRSVARLMVRAHKLGWRRIAVYGCHGDRFLACGLGPGSRGMRIDLYGSTGDYLGSGVDGAEIHVHGDAQDQVGQVLKSGRIVIHGNVGQTLLYGAKGGEVFVRGNTAGRPLINAVGDVRVIVNGTCLDYAAESFMAGAVTGGGFLVINGLCNLDDGRVYGLEVKYPGTNLFSLASGGCCYLNDPYFTVSESQLNGARFDPFLQEDWNVLETYLRTNQTIFRIHTRYDLLMVDGVLRWPKEVFRKVVPATAPEPVE